MANAIVSFEGGSEALPALIDRAALALTSARSSAEVLEARDMARMAYDAARTAGRIARAKEAHDEVIAAVYRAQADAAVIEARAKVRLADEYDAAQDRGDVASGSTGRGDKIVVGNNDIRPATAADLGLRRDEIHEARKIRDAEAKEPGKIKAAADALVKRGKEPTKSALRREIVGEPAPADEPKGSPDDDKLDRKLRRDFRRLTKQAQEDDWVGIKRALHDEKAKCRRLREENERLKEQVRDFSGDQAEVIRRQAKTLRYKDSEIERANANFIAEKKKSFALKKRIAELELENQVIPL